MLYGLRIWNLHVGIVFRGCTMYRPKRNDAWLVYLEQKGRNPEHFRVSSTVVSSHFNCFSRAYNAREKHTYNKYLLLSQLYRSCSHFISSSLVIFVGAEWSIIAISNRTGNVLHLLNTIENLFRWAAIDGRLTLRYGFAWQVRLRPKSMDPTIESLFRTTLREITGQPVVNQQ